MVTVAMPGTLSFPVSFLQHVNTDFSAVSLKDIQGKSPEYFWSNISGREDYFVFEK